MGRSELALVGVTGEARGMGKGVGRCGTPGSTGINGQAEVAVATAPLHSNCSSPATLALPLLLFWLLLKFATVAVGACDREK